jgi:hypothetical protein
MLHQAHLINFIMHCKEMEGGKFETVVAGQYDELVSGQNLQNTLKLEMVIQFKFCSKSRQKEIKFVM